jgi:hypothetical protein
MIVTYKNLFWIAWIISRLALRYPAQQLSFCGGKPPFGVKYWGAGPPHYPAVYEKGLLVRATGRTREEDLKWQEATEGRN